MASMFGHSASALGILTLFPRKLFAKKVIFLGMLSSVIPDIDVLAYKYGISGLHILGHRGITHSILFALFWGLLIVSLFIGKRHKIKFF